MSARLLALALVLLAPSASATTATGGTGGSPSDFSMTIDATRADGYADAVTIGASAGATDGFDRALDVATPPAPMGDAWVRMFVEGPDKGALGELSTSIARAAGTLEWRVNVTARGPGAINISWDPGELADAGAPGRIRFTLEADGATLDMSANDSIELAAEPASRIVVVRALLVEPPPTAPPATTTTTAAATPSTSATGTPVGAPGEEEPAPTPGFGLVLLVAALGLASRVRRRA